MEDITHRLIDPIIFCTAIFIVWVGTKKSTMTIKLKPCQMLSSMTKKIMDMEFDAIDSHKNKFEEFTFGSSSLSEQKITLTEQRA